VLSIVLALRVLYALAEKYLDGSFLPAPLMGAGEESLDNTARHA
jgi:hypothetical protein